MDKAENKIETSRLLDSLYRLFDMSQGVPKKLHILSDVVIARVSLNSPQWQPASDPAQCRWVSVLLRPGQPPAPVASCSLSFSSLWHPSLSGRELEEVAYMREERQRENGKNLIRTFLRDM